MPLLRAQFNVELPRPLLILGARRAESDTGWHVPSEVVLQRVCLGGFTCEVELQLPFGHPALTKKDEAAYFTASELSLSVFREDPDAPPAAPRNDQGHRDLRARSEYFDKRYDEYVSVARQVVERIMNFGRYALGIDSFRDMREVSPDCFNNPEWYYDQDGPLASGTVRFDVAFEISKDPGLWSMSGISPQNHTWLSDAVDSEVCIPLHRELHALSKDAARAGDLRRAVIEMAVALEVGTKHAFFAPASAAFEAFEFLEEKRKVEVSVLELLKQPAERAFGTSFRDVDAHAFKLVEEVFRCRNKVAHRGRLEYRDAKGKLRTADREVVREWWQASESVLDWLEADCGLEKISGVGASG